MKYLMRQGNGIWVAAREQIAGNKTKEEIVKDLQDRTKAAQVWFFDLDDNHADAPARKIVMKMVGTNAFDPKFIWWVLTRGFPARFNKNGESRAFRQYLNSFLRSKEALQRVKALYTRDIARQSLYPGVMDFCDLFPNAKKFYITRNIAEVADVFNEVLSFDGFFPEAYDKGKVIERYLNKNQDVKDIGIDGDSREDAEMIRVARSFGKSVVSFYSMEKLRDTKMNKDFDYAVSKDRRGLVEILKRRDAHVDY